ncbi:transcriptional repressor LexA [Weissella hellenica]|uniref:Repressor LexA n=1 Tax=Weissella hellenica TaxID=46256 RepID=A0A4Y4G2A2_WEIHE|nr:transcriptional repressor LexA [Weissella hellenica]NKY67390.1 repressor LexA [Weissella hellenica]GED36369.1 LexA repressor [Weissella hellenica]SCC04919.1 repressor LexA [Weissella hellenica]
MTNKSTKQLDILKFIYEKQQQRGYPPTVREIGDGVGLASSSTVHGHLTRLQNKGFIQKKAEKTRAITVTNTGIQALKKADILALPDTSAPVISTPQDIISSLDEDTILLQHNSNTMINIGILNRDYLLIKKESAIPDGAIVAVTLDKNNDGTSQTDVYRYFKERNQVRLQPENSNLKPVITNHVEIIGKVIGVYRNEIN